MWPVPYSGFPVILQHCRCTQPSMSSGAYQRSAEWSRTASSFPSPLDIFSDLWSSPVSWPVGYPWFSFGPSVGTNQWLLLWKMSDEDLSRRALGNPAPASAARPLFLGFELELSTPPPSRTPQTPCFVNTISALSLVNTVHFSYMCFCAQLTNRVWLLQPNGL